MDQTVLASNADLFERSIFLEPRERELITEEINAALTAAKDVCRNHPLTLLVEGSIGRGVKRKFCVWVYAAA